MGNKCGIILDQSLKTVYIPYNIYHYPNSVDSQFLNRGYNKQSLTEK